MRANKITGASAPVSSGHASTATPVARVLGSDDGLLGPRLPTASDSPGRERFWRKRRPNPIIGVIWRWDHCDWLRQDEAERWERELLPFGWAIISDQRAALSERP